MSANLNDKKVLVLGLGLLGGGIATTNWLLDHGAQVTVTDLKDAKQLAPSVKKVEDHVKKAARDGRDYTRRRARLAWALGGHTNALVDAADLVVVNPDVSVRNPYVQHALAAHIKVANEGTLFYRLWKRRTVGITGTRGKTTTANWTHHFIVGSVLTGNSTVKPFLSALDERATVAVTELSSFVLEFFPYITQAPDIAVITNLYRDHLNRHGTMEGYADAKANIFRRQKRSGTLILNAQDAWTPWFLAQSPPGRVLLTSQSPLTGDTNGVWYGDGVIYERAAGRDRRVLDVHGFAQQWGAHNVANLLAAALAARAAGVPWSRIQARIPTLPSVQYRQEVVYRDPGLTVINDTTATSPDGAIAALHRWGGPNCILICGGTDRDLDYRAWAEVLPTRITKNNTVFLAGSATQKMKAALKTAARGIRTYDTLEDAWRAALKRSGQFVSAVVLFSPGAKSFELFANEFDRGQQFNALVERDAQEEVVVVETTTYVDEAFLVLTGAYPEATVKPRDRRIVVMRHWDGRKFDGDRNRELIAKMALCQIGLAWHPSDQYPYRLGEVTERLREMMPELGAKEITGRTMLDIVRARHPSQYAQRRTAPAPPGKGKDDGSPGE